MRRALVQLRRVRVQGSFPAGKIPLRRRPSISVSWLPIEVGDDVFILLVFTSTQAAGFVCISSAPPLAAGGTNGTTFVVVPPFGRMAKNCSASAGLFRSR